ncbi:dihydroorotate dehydrogenase [Trichonephila inaurata madagascariensis]|uniref:Dihydroorotate dehydrogenase (quinone), mitochondrial n=1 Tax=Trichonephila inaurata madagascariensis TaxID=2747483 RepID=A0A8X7C1U3_9ARAC|nr:dihydroorotate dehydrogenase [Trichonephila inaurata madagascariensis]
MSQRNLWKKLKSMTLLAAGGSVTFAAISLYQGNEKFYKNIAMPTLHYFLSPETSQNLGIFAAKWALIPKCKVEDGFLLRTSLWGLEFSNPIGIAAGLDKNGEAYSGLFKSGIGFMEVGTVTPLPQSGNPKPRIFMLPEDEALINRCGFNSEGHNYVKRNLSIRNETGILGVNLGKNKESKSAEEDYVLGVSEFAPMADYLTINVSSPNTPGLRSLQNRKELEHLLDKVLEARDNSDKKPPILLKIAPDLTHEEKKDIAHVVLRKGKKIDGLIVSNTTISRPESLRGQHKDETGGLSGKPLKQMSTEAIKDMYKLTGGQIPIIGVGGVSSGKDAFEKIKAGASLIQLYTALSYEGPPVIGKIKRELKELLITNNYHNIADAIGADNR